MGATYATYAMDAVDIVDAMSAMGVVGTNKQDQIFLSSASERIYKMYKARYLMQFDI